MYVYVCVYVCNCLCMCVLYYITKLYNYTGLTILDIINIPPIYITHVIL